MTETRSATVGEAGRLKRDSGWPEEITFADGLVGCADWRRFLLVEEQAAGPVMLLQCIDDTEVGFFVADPSAIVDDYQLEITQEAADAIGLRDWREARVLCTLVMRQDPPLVTANLLGPLVINPENGRAVQVVLGGTRYSARHPIAEELKGDEAC